MNEVTDVFVLARLLWISGTTSKEESIELAWVLLTVLEEEGWVLVKKDALNDT